MTRGDPGGGPGTADDAPMKIPARLQVLSDEGLIDSVLRQLKSGNEGEIVLLTDGVVDPHEQLRQLPRMEGPEVADRAVARDVDSCHHSPVLPRRLPGWELTGWLRCPLGQSASRCRSAHRRQEQYWLKRADAANLATLVFVSVYGSSAPVALSQR